MFDFTPIVAMAGQPGAPGGQGGAGGAFGMFVPMLIIFAIFYFMLIRPQQRKEKERRQMIDSVKSGARVIFGGGIYGTVTNIKDNVFTIKIADNVKVDVLRAAVSQVLDKGDKPDEAAATAQR